MKAMESAGALWTTDQPATSVRRDEAKSTSKTAETGAKDDGGADETRAATPVTPKPKAKAQKMPAAKTTGSSTKRGRKANESAVDGNETTNENATRKKKTKVTPGPVTEE